MKPGYKIIGRADRKEAHHSRQMRLLSSAHMTLNRVRQLAERYATPPPRLAEGMETLAARIDEHLEKTGFVWR